MNKDTNHPIIGHFMFLEFFCINIPASATLITLAQKFPDFLMDTPVIFPLPEDAPNEVVRVIFNLKDKLGRIFISKERITIDCAEAYWQNGSVAKFLCGFFDLFQKGCQIKKMVYSVRKTVAVKQPAQELYRQLKISEALCTDKNLLNLSVVYQKSETVAHFHLTHTIEMGTCWVDPQKKTGDTDGLSLLQHGIFTLDESSLTEEMIADRIKAAAALFDETDKKYEFLHE